jgi:tRNA-dihydrouridine synthase B
MSHFSRISCDYYMSMSDFGQKMSKSGEGEADEALRVGPSPAGLLPGLLQAGPLKLHARALLAPMAGVTDLGMRGLALRFGAGLAASEMLAAENYADGDRETRIRAASSGDGPHAVQIAGCRAEGMAEAARRAEAEGADLIDINMGCPAKRVTGGLAGSALMRDLDLAVNLIRATCAAVKVPVSLKMRLGWDETTINSPELARRAAAEGVVMVSVHGRTRNQFYNGRADWLAIRQVKEAMVKSALDIPVVANGDCASEEDAAAMLEASRADAVMIGRAALGRPWLVGDIAHFLATGRKRAQRTPAERLAAALEHYRTILSLFGVQQGVRHARKHLAAYAHWAGVVAGSETARQLVRSEDPAQVEALLAASFDNAHLAAAA